MVSCTLLIYKLEALNILENILNWMRDYLTWRRQEVVINEIQSRLVEASSGVPQDSVLRSLLFLVFINDIANDISSSGHLYGHDYIVFQTIETEADSAALQANIDSIWNWCSKWNMKLNTKKKCNLIRFTRKHDAILSNFKTDTCSIGVVHETKHSGIYFTENLMWTKHTNCISAGANRMLGF